MRPYGNHVGKLGLFRGYCHVTGLTYECDDPSGKSVPGTWGEQLPDVIRLEQCDRFRDTLLPVEFERPRDFGQWDLLN
jgi:hypothetical protein